MHNPGRPDEGGQGAPRPAGTALHRRPQAGQTACRRQRVRLPGRSGKKPMLNMVLLMTMRRPDSDYTVHGFRSAFREWASERTNFAREICEAALANIIKDKTEAAYRRGDLFEKRCELMATWATYVEGASAMLIQLKPARTNG